MARGFSRRLLAATAAICLSGSLLWLPSPAYADAARDSQWHLPFLKISEAHKISQGEGIVVAVIDTGVNETHEDLVGNILPGTDTVAGGKGNGHGDARGHGTGMAGLIVAHGHGTGGADGMLGIAPKAKVLPIRTNIEGNLGPAAPFVQAVDYAIANNAKIISFSGAVQRTDETMQAVQRAQAAGLLVIAASGNKPEDSAFIAAPASYRGVIAVGATDRDGNVAEISRGGPELSLTAPGVDINSTGTGGNSAHRTGTGTSGSTAIVAGVAALVWSQNPSLTAREVTTLLTSTATDKGPTGRDPDYGYGIVDPVAALTRGRTPSDSPTPHSASSESAGQSSGAPADESGISGVLTAGIALSCLILVAVIAVVVFLALRRRRSPVPNAESRQ